MVPATTPLIGFSEEIIWPMGQISLPVKIGDAEHSTSIWINFVVVRSPSPYNGIIGRLGVRKIQAVPSTAHEMLKFPILGGILTLRSNKIILLECMMVSGPKAQPSAITREGQKELCDLLRRNLDIFAWKPTDMTGVLRHIAEHRLNVREGCPPVRQKKRSQAPETNKAIQEEVEKLVDAGIMKEVHYHSWLSNPNVRATYHRLVDKAFQKQIGRNLEVFLAKSAEKSLPFFKTLKKCTKKSDFQWTAEAGAAFKQMKKLIAELPTLTAPMEKEELIVYLEPTREAMSTVLITEREAKQMPIYFVSRTLQGPEINYTPMEMPRISVKGKVLVNFIVERPKDDSSATPIEVEEELSEPWILFTNESFCIDGSEAGLILTDLEGIKFTYALRFRFNATNNEAEYEALIVDLRIAEQIGVKNLQTHVDSRLVANQINVSYTAKEPDMMQYLEKVKMLASNFKKFSIKNPQQKLTPITSPWPFYKWGIDIAVPFPKGPGKVKFLIVAMDYFTKWIEVNPIAAITGNQIKKFVWDNIVCRFGLPGEIISDNGKQFRDNPFKDCLGEGVKARLDKGSKDWIEEIPHVLWVHRTMIKLSNGDTPFSLTYGTKAVIPAEIDMPTLWTAEVDMV
ncbi:reverse transcriptase domain-containing protein [Tanacetum coccineum]